MTGDPRERGFESYVAARGDALWRTAWLLTGDSHLAEEPRAGGAAEGVAALGPGRR